MRISLECVYVHIFVCVCVYVCVCVQKYRHICIFICTYTVECRLIYIHTTGPVRATGSGKACKDAVTQVKNAQASGEEGGGLVMHSSVVRGLAGEPLLDLSLCHPEVCVCMCGGVRLVYAVFA